MRHQPVQGTLKTWCNNRCPSQSCGQSEFTSDDRNARKAVGTILIVVLKVRANPIRKNDSIWRAITPKDRVAQCKPKEMSVSVRL